MRLQLHKHHMSIEMLATCLWVLHMKIDGVSIGSDTCYKQVIKGLLLINRTRMYLGAQSTHNVSEMSITSH